MNKRLGCFALLSSSVYASESSDEIVAALAKEGLLKGSPEAASQVVDTVLQSQSWIPSMSTVLQVCAVLLILIATSGWISKLVKWGWMLFASIPLSVYQVASLGILGYAMTWTVSHPFMFVAFAQFVNGLSMLGVCSWWSATHRTLVRKMVRKIPWSPTYNLQMYVTVFAGGMTYYTGSAWFLSLLGLVVLSVIFMKPAQSPRGLTDAAWGKVSIEQLFIGEVREYVNIPWIGAAIPLLMVYTLMDSQYFVVLNLIMMLAVAMLSDAAFNWRKEADVFSFLSIASIVPMLYTGMPWFVVIGVLIPHILRLVMNVMKAFMHLPWLVKCTLLGLMLFFLSWMLRQPTWVAQMVEWKDTVWMYLNKAYYTHAVTDWFKTFSHY